MKILKVSAIVKTCCEINGKLDLRISHYLLHTHFIFLMHFAFCILHFAIAYCISYITNYDINFHPTHP